METLKRFIEWIQLKQKVHENDDNHLLFGERDVWMCYVGENVGHESNGKNALFHRPVLVLHKFNKYLFYGLPMSTKIKENPFYVPIEFRGKKQAIMIAQMRVFDVRRLHYKKGRLSPEDFQMVKARFLEIFQKITPRKRGAPSGDL